MIKETITYTNVDGNKETIDAYFHLTKADCIELAAGGFGERMSDVSNLTNNDILDIFRTLVRMSYGSRKEINGHVIFTKNEEDTEIFMNSDAFGELIMKWLNDPQSASDFISKLMPNDLIEAAKKAQEAQAMHQQGANNAQIAASIGVAESSVSPVQVGNTQPIWTNPYAGGIAPIANPNVVANR